MKSETIPVSSILDKGYSTCNNWHRGEVMLGENFFSFYFLYVSYIKLSSILSMTEGYKDYFYFTHVKIVSEPK